MWILQYQVMDTVEKLLSPVLLNQSAISPLLKGNFWLFCSVDSTLIGYLWECMVEDAATIALFANISIWF
jgi:hypothetical protein